MREQQDIQTVTLAFEEFRGRHEDEAPIAAEIAARYGTRHTTRFVTEQEFRDDLPKILDAMDQPTIDGLNTWFVSKAARELGLKVAISGLGGDELFGGYPSFRDVPLWVRALASSRANTMVGRSRAQDNDQPWSVLSNRKSQGSRSAEIRRNLCRRILAAPRTVHAVGTRSRRRTRYRPRRFTPPKPASAHRSSIETSAATSFGKVAVLESSLYMRNQLLRDTDWASMAHSLEVRVPLVDAELLKPCGAGHDQRECVIQAHAGRTVRVCRSPPV